MTLNNLRKNTYFKYAKEITIEIICIGLLILTLLFLCDGLNAPYQNLKDLYAFKGFLCFAVYLLFLQRPRLINWQSALASLLYLPLAYSYAMRYPDSPDLYRVDRVVIWIVWVALLILVDMYVYKKVNPLDRLNKLSLFIYSMMLLAMLYCRNGRNYPVVLLFMFVLYLIPLDAGRWKRIINQFCNAWIITYFIILYHSLISNPGTDITAGYGRWYGCFVNIGDFGLFMGCVLVALLFSIYKARKSKKYKYIPFIIYLACLIPVIWTVMRISTVTLYIGIVFIFVMCFLLFTKRNTISATVKRLIIAVVLALVIGVVGFIGLKELANTDAEYWEEIAAGESTLLKPISNMIYRAHHMFDEPRTFADAAVFIPDSFINYVDLFASGRLSLMKVFSGYFTFVGSPSYGIQIGEYFAYTAHNTYIQTLYEYGYIGGGFFLLWLLNNTLTSMYRYIKTKKRAFLFSSIWMAMALGVFWGESANLHTPIIFMTMFITYPIMVHMPDNSKKVQ